MTSTGGWAVLEATSSKSKAAEHLDRSTDKSQDVAIATLAGPDIALSLVKTTVGRMLMNAEGTARASNQVADILMDIPSGAFFFAESVVSRRRVVARARDLARPSFSPDGKKLAPLLARVSQRAHPPSPPRLNDYSEREALRHHVRDDP